MTARSLAKAAASTIVGLAVILSAGPMVVWWYEGDTLSAALSAVTTLIVSLAVVLVLYGQHAEEGRNLFTELLKEVKSLKAIVFATAKDVRILRMKEHGLTDEEEF